MQWSTQILMTLLLIQIIHVHSINSEEDHEEHENMEKMSLELIHRHDSRFLGEIDQVEAIKGFIKRDIFRREMMDQRIGMNYQGGHGNNRRKDIEMKQDFEFSMHSGRDVEIGEYFVGVTVGTPGQKFWLIADTGSELTWFKCMRKVHHNHQHKHKHNKHKGGSKTKSRTKSHTARRRRAHSHNPCDDMFCPHRSHTFHQISCSSKMCIAELPYSLTDCQSPSDPCLYEVSYGSGISSAVGFYGTDTISINLSNKKIGKLQNQTIGCTQSVINSPGFPYENVGGILALGFRHHSFVDNAGLKFGSKFSYCLVDHLSHKNVSSYLTFGTTPKVKLLSEIKRTDMLLYQPFYGVNVTGISVDDQMLKIPPKVWDFEAGEGMIIDSGFTLTALVLEAYYPVVEALKKSLHNVKTINDPNNGGLEVCFDAEGFDESIAPRLVFHFGGGIRFEPPVKSYIIDAAPKTKCLGFLPVNGTRNSIIGNIMQQNHLWEFDIYKNTIGFAPSPCN